ncbi:hypothetical protein [Pseudoclavibacter endophyticus]|uniref:Uncharacterized protein n=1 Tax=Pseudoclavibacter endophyticus TaxID=1778590 RepID=A0A6H9WKZ3_9MICO|nr:hypothetical protein [Pseudoclavibacter endophyticus]KAB1649823.1 hypothetical protein F8O04_06230 [Pseudoclavibacter endophyticus]
MSGAEQTSAVPGYEQTTAMPQQTSAYGQDSSTGFHHDPGAAQGASAAGAAGYGGAGWPPHQGDPAGSPAEGPRDGQKKPWYKRAAIMIPAIGGVVLLILAAIGIPLGIHLTNVAKGDQLADDFTAALEAHNSTWTQDEIDKVANVVVSEALAENADFNSQNSSVMSDFEARCEGVATAATTLETLAASPVPSLAEEDGADASAKYQEALETSNGLAERRAAVETLTGTGVEAMTALSEFCTVYPQYNSLLNTYVVNLTTTLQDSLTIANGSDIEFGNGLFITCTSSGGCPNYGTQEGRDAYANAIDATNTAYYSDTAELAGAQCFLPELEDVCATMASEYQATADAYAEAAQSMRTEQPNLTAGERPFPNTFDLLDAADQARAAADSAIDSAWQAADPNAAGDSGTGWQARSIKGILAGHETVVTDAVAQLGS